MGKKRLPWKIIAPFIAVLLIVAGACAFKLGKPAQEPDEEPSQQQPDSMRNVQKDAEEGAALSEGQRKTVEGYGEAEIAVAELLRANVWASGTSSATLRFGENSIDETKEDAPDIRRPFVITACKLETVTHSPDGYATKYTCSVDVGEAKNHILTLSKEHPASGVEQPWTLESDCFAYSAAYARIEAAMDFEIKGLNDSIRALLGGDGNAESMQAVLKSYCSQNYPSATSATWDEKASIDYKGNSLMLAFQLDNGSRTTVKVLNALGTDSFEVGR